MKRPKAFTLRDLVALLCLAALALPILAATVRDAAGKSAAARCRTNLASLTRCILVYTEQNRGFMPVYQHFSTTGSNGVRYIRAPNNTYKSYVSFTDMGNPRVNPTTGLLSDARGLGLVYTRGYARPPELFYCPGPMPDVRATLAYYPKPWGSKVGVGSMFIRIGYMWNPWVMRIPGGSENQWTFDDRLVLRRHPADRPLLCDLISEMTVTSHTEPGSALWNMAYPDGRVTAFQDPEVYQMLVQGADTSMDWALFNQLVRPHLPGATVGAAP
ncbi:MAG: hypothetical protein MUP47_11580 [Phycisphaerae bacterium]|nr:hypothetical protein [Phycisphaerae bacterium]